MQTNVFNRLSFLSIFLTVVLLPVFFLPFTNISTNISKGLLLVVGLTLSVIFWSISRFFDGRISFPKSLVLLGGLGVVLVSLLSAIFSGTQHISFFGTMFDTGSFWFIFCGFLLMLMSSILFRSPKAAKTLLLGIILSSVLLLLFQATRFFLPDLLSLGVLSGKTGNVLGSWNTLGIFAGFSVLTSLLVIEFFSVTRMEKIILQVLGVFSMIFVAVVNFQFVWELIGITSLIIFIYKISIINRGENQEEGQDENNKTKDFPAFSFLIIIISLMFFVSGQFIGGFLPSRLGVENSEVRPSLKSTMSVTGSVLRADPILGIGPNRFDEAWAMHKPLAVNNTQYWDVAFSSGSGLLPTLTATTGYLGILAWLAFLILFLLSGARSIFSSVKNGLNWETMAFFVLSLYLFIASFFYPTGPVIFLLALSFAGVFIGLSSSNEENGEVSFSFLNDHRKSFFSMLFIVILVIVTVATSFKYIERFASVPYFGRSLSAPSIEVAETSINRALSLHRNDLYLRTYAQVYLLKLNSLINESASSAPEAGKANLQNTFDQARGGAQLAVAHNPANYLNHQALGSIYRTAAVMGVKDAYSKAVDSFTQASSLNPNNPGIRLAIAGAYLSNGNTTDAKEQANEALALKSNYIDALIVLSQISVQEGDRTEAISYAERALALTPLNESLINYVDALKNTKSSDVTVPTPSDEDEESPIDTTNDISTEEN